MEQGVFGRLSVYSSLVGGGFFGSNFGLKALFELCAYFGSLERSHGGEGGTRGSGTGSGRQIEKAS